jgi:glucose-6-phosphate 1-epimerase
VTALPDPVDLSCDSCSCHAYLHGAHLVDWRPRGARGVLWLSPLARLDSAAAIRGGVPLVFPWFGPGVSGTMLPPHGFGRLADWHLAPVERDVETVTAVFGLDSSVATSDEFPHRYTARYVIRAGEQLSLELTVENAGELPFTYEAVFHTYLAVGDIERVTIEGLDGAEYADKAAGPAAPNVVQSGDITLLTETDRVYRSTADVRVVDHGQNRVLVVRKCGSRSTIVWNPGERKGAAAADIGPDHWREFVCVEAGNVAGDATTLAPGGSATMSCVIDVEPLIG